MEQRVEDDEEFIACWKDRYCLIIPNEHPLAYQEKIALKDFNNLPFIQRTFCDRSQEMAAFMEHHDIQLEFVAEVDNEEWATSLVASGLGLAIVPLPHEFDPEGRFTVKPIGEIQGLHTFERSVGVAIRYLRYSNPYFQQLANYLKQVN